MVETAPASAIRDSPSLASRRRDLELYEATFSAADAAILASERKLAEYSARVLSAKRKRRRSGSETGGEGSGSDAATPKQAVWPFTSQGEVLEAAVQGIANVIGVDPPPFDLSVEPVVVFAWARDEVLKYGQSRREEGVAAATGEGATPRLSGDTALEAMKLIEKLNNLL